MPYIRVSIVLVESPRQYAPAIDCSFSAPMLLVLGACGPRHRSVNGPFVYSDTVCSGRGRVGALHEVVDQLDLVVLTLVHEPLPGLRRRHLLALERLRRLDVRAHPLFDLRELGLGESRSVGKLEVVIEPLLDRRADRDLHAGIQLHHGRSQHMRGVVPDQLQRLLAALLRQDRHVRPVGQRALKVAHLGPLATAISLGMADLDRQRRSRQAGPDRRGRVGAGGAVGQLQRLSVRERDRDRHRPAGYSLSDLRDFRNGVLNTVVCICDDRAMTETEPQSISIKLSPAQIDDVVRAASQSRAPSISTLIANTLNAPLAPANGETSDEALGASRLGGYMPIGAVDPRLSRSLLRGLSILTCFGPDGDPRGIVEIAEELRMSPSTTHRYALTLVELGLLERCPTTRKYRLPAV